jgi:hypothetical protein
MTPVVYFARAGRFVKIGTTCYPERRVQQIRRATSGGAVPLDVDRRTTELVTTVPGGRAHERAMHERFVEARAVGEWFHATPELLAFIAIAESVPA